MALTGRLPVPWKEAMNEEFGAIGAFLCDYPDLVMLVERAGVTITALAREHAERWADYVRHCEHWTHDHVPSGYPVSSLFRGAYMTLEAHVLSDATRPRYQAMLEELSSHGETYVVHVWARQW